MIQTLNLDVIEREPIDASTKGFPHGAPPIPLREIGTQGWHLLQGSLPLPQAVLKDSALTHNHEWMRDFTQATGVLLAPHGKTTMAPQIFAQQLVAGAWGITVATVHQLAVCARFGVRRVIMANQLLGAAAVAEVLRLQEQHPDLEFYFLVDSLAQLRSIEADVGLHARSRRLCALLELGVRGGRTGCRNTASSCSCCLIRTARALVSTDGSRASS